MKNVLLGSVGAACLVAASWWRRRSRSTRPTRSRRATCARVLHSRERARAYTEKAIAEKLTDQQVRDVEIGKAHVGIGMVHRGKLDAPGAELGRRARSRQRGLPRDLDGSATLVLGPDIANRQRRPATLRTVREFNGPGNNGSEIRNGVAYQIKAGDVVVIPAGTGHWFTKIDDHIDYLMVRIDPDKVTPLKDEAASKAYLSKPASAE